MRKIKVGSLVRHMRNDYGFGIVISISEGPWSRVNVSSGAYVTSGIKMYRVRWLSYPNEVVYLRTDLKVTS